MNTEEHRERLKNYGLRVTPQRMAVMEAVEMLHSHPSADEVSQFIRQNYPAIATGTIYKTLDTLVEKGLIRRVKTDRDIMRYDAILQSHHHLYCAVRERIEDYYDDELDNILNEYFKRRKIKDFDIEEIRLQIVGRFPDCDKEKHKNRKH